MWSPGRRYAFINGAIYEARDLAAHKEFGRLTPVAKMWGRKERCGPGPDPDSYEWLDDEHLSNFDGDCGCIYNLVVDVRADRAYWFRIDEAESSCVYDYGEPEDYRDLVRILSQGESAEQR